MTMIFTIGAIVGLAATWWMSRPADKPPASAAVQKFEPRPEAAKRGESPSAPSAAAVGAASGNSGVGTGHSTAGSAASGINPGELPYDGMSPAAGLGSAPAVASESAARRDADEPPPTAAIAPGANNSITGGPRQPPEQAVDTSAATRALPGTPRAATGATGEKGTKSAKSENGEKALAIAPGSGGKESVAKPQEAKVAKAAPRSRPLPKVAKDREIERIQQQVDEELKKKTRTPDVKLAARPRTEETEKKIEAPGYAASQGSKRAGLARCERDEESLIGREWCKWKVCSGSWGKNGCPSYERQASTHY
jgi:hypothetical protein